MSLMNQIQIYKKMTGENRLEQAFELSELTRELAIINIKENFPKLSKKGIIKKLRERIDLDSYGTKRDSDKNRPKFR